jgi:hypothetical protein
MRKSKLLFFIILSGFLTKTYGQSSTPAFGMDINKTFPSPNVAALGNFGLIPANPFNGQAIVSVPIYTVAYKDLAIPISLSYATGGNKPDDHPGWTGLGWAFQAGGMIYRKVNGWYDEYPPGQSPNASGTFNLSYFDNCGRIAANFNNQDTIAAYTTIPGISYGFDGIADEFIFNFNEYSGTFYITRPSINAPVEIKIKPNGNYKLKAEIMEMRDNIVFDDYIQLNGTFSTRRTSRSIYKIKITDDNGIQYIFGGTPAAIEFSNNGNFTNDFYTIASSWHLTEVISPAGYKIQLTYKKKGRVIEQAKQRSATFYDLNYDFGSVANIGLLFAGSSGSIAYSGGLDNTNFSFQNPAWLDSIKTPQQIVTFSSSRTSELDYPFELDKIRPITDPDYRFGAIDNYWQKLDDINIIGLKNIHFNYRHQTTSRLRLDSIEFRTPGQQKIMGYGFVYNSLQLPAYNARMSDHWGYYNGRVYAYGNNYKELREPQAQYLQAEMLQQINYPTGGYLKLEYEPHYYSKIAKQFPFTVEGQSTNLMAGGLRIKKMTSTSNSNDVPVTKEYFYTTNYIGGGDSSSGILAGEPQYTNTGTVRDSYHSGNFWGTSWGSLAINFGSIVDNNFLQLSNTNGNHVTYSEVTERSGKGYTVYKYTNHDNGYLDKLPYVILSNFTSAWHEEGFVSLSFYRGQPLSTTWYDELKRKVKKVSMTYLIDTAASWKIPVFHRSGTNLPNVNISLTRVATCAFFIKPPLERTIIDTEYVAGTANSLVTNANYRYYTDVYPTGAATNDNFKVAEINSVNSKNVLTRTLSNYPAYMVLNGTDPAGIYQEMVSNNIVSPVIEETQFRGTTQVELKRTNYIKPYTGVYVPGTIEVKPFADASEVRYQAYQYDAQGNVTEQSKNSDVHEVLLWGYKGQFPVARVVGSSYATVSSLVDLNLLTNAASYTDAQVRTELNKIRTGLPGSQVTTFTYTPLLGMTSETDIKGYSKFYEYDEAGRLKIIRDQDNNVLKKFCYSYAGSSIKCDGTVYYNAALSQAFTKQGCTGCDKGSSVTYTIPDKKYYSEISQADADAKAQADMNANGQNYANVNGICYAPPIFVKFTLGDFVGELGDIVTAPAKLQFYSDTDYTVPYSVINLDVNYSTTTSTCGSNPSTSTVNQSITCNGTETNFTVQVAWDLQDGIHCWYKTYSLLPGNCYYHRVYYNSARSQVFTRNNCAAGLTGTPVTYTVPARKYRSVVSQDAADAPAIAEINNNGQAYANTNGQCVYYNIAKSQSFTRNNCPSPQIGGTVTYTVPANRYSSTSSQADADAQAQNDINANGQNYANANGTCTMPGFPYVTMSVGGYTDNDPYTNATLTFRFWADAAKTIPMSVSNLTVNYKVTTTPCTGSSSSGNTTAVCSGTSYGVPVQVAFDLGDGKHCWGKSFTLLAGTGYYQ